MRVTGPAVRRRNHAWLQMRSLDRRAARLARRQELDDDSANDADSSGDESASSVDSDADDSDSDFDSDVESDVEPTKTTVPPVVSATVSATASAGLSTGRGAILLPTAVPDVSTGVTLGAGEGVEVEEPDDGVESVSESDGEESADESTASPTNTTPPAGGQTPPPLLVTSIASTSTGTSTSTRGSSSPSSLTLSIVSSTVTAAPSGSSTSSLDDLVTSLTGTSLVASSTTAPAPSVPVTGSNQSEDAQVIPPNRSANEREGDDVTVGMAPNNNLSSGAIAGIVLGVITFVGLVAGALLFWHKRRGGRGLPFFPQPRFRLKDDDESSAPSVSGPLPGPVGGPSHVKTNTQIMDDLMKAAYAANNGTNDMQGAYAPPAVSKLPPQLPPPQQQQREEEIGVFLDEKAYAALAGPPTPMGPKKPVMKWLDEVKTPTQPNGPEIPPTPQMPPSATMPQRPMAGGRVPEPPKPAYYGRDTMTTDTTNTSVRWYG